MTGRDDWIGRVGDVWAQEWRRTDRTFCELAPVLDARILAAAPAGRGRALDIGCGAGSTSIALATARPDMAVTGIDVAPALVAVAERRGAHLPNLAFRTADAGDRLPDLPLADLLLSRHGVMFFDDPGGAFARLRRAAAPGAALVFSCVGAVEANRWAGELVAAVTDAAPPAPSDDRPGPFAFADPDRVTALLAGAGWTGIGCERVDYDYVAGEGADAVDEAVGLFARIGPAAAALHAAPPDERDRLRARLAAVVARYHARGRVAFPASAWIWQARA